MSEYRLNPNYASPDVAQEPTRAGFGRGLKQAGSDDERVVALCADLTDSTQMSHFAKAFPERFVEIGVAEQNLVTVASGMARMGKIPFTSSYAAFSPGRNWEQIRTTICLNEQPVKIVGSHAGVSVGPDGATHQMLEDIALMRVLPHMIVVNPGDALEAEKATRALAQDDKNPGYIRLAREKTPIFSTEHSPFEIGKAYVLHQGSDVTIVSTGTMTAQALIAGSILREQGINAEIVHAPTIKPFDVETFIASVSKTGRVVSVEEAQAAAGFGGLIAETLGDHLPAPLLRIGMNDRFGESGSPDELLAHFGFDSKSIAQKVREFIDRVPQYKKGY
ncbi:MAG TPA: transketolase C-terminal domain-containing protein [Patescibacteria group bacterium]|nr:transketolase C-terminal domain-containing protein [Patescibacteria group bacterium]